MIDFRYHLVSLVAVFLALGLGILMGTAVLNDQLVKQLKSNVVAAQKKNATYEQTIEDLDQHLDSANAFANEAAPWITKNVLSGRPVVFVDVEGTDGDMLSELQDAVRNAGGEVASTITLTVKFALRDQTSRDQLALDVDSVAGQARQLRVDAGTLLGERLSSAAAQVQGERPQVLVQQRLNELMSSLQDTDFAAVKVDQGHSMVPPGSMFVFAAGSTAKRPFDLSSLALPLTRSLAEHGADVLAAESSDSTWGVVATIIDDPLAAASVTTVDQADLVEGRVAVILALDRTGDEGVGHYGTGPGATDVLPRPSNGP